MKFKNISTSTPRLQILCSALVAIVVFDGGALAQTSEPQTPQIIEPTYMPDGLELGFGMLRDRILEGQVLVSNGDVDSALTCASLCKKSEVCRSFTYIASSKTCEFKGNNTFSKIELFGYISGISLAIRDFETFPDSDVEFPYETLPVKTPNSLPNICADLCQNSSPNDSGHSNRCRSFSSNVRAKVDQGIVGYCRFSSSENLINVDAKIKPGYNAGRPIKPFDNFVIVDSIASDGSVVRRMEDLSSLKSCASECQNEKRCNSFSFSSGTNSMNKGSICTLTEGRRFADGWTPGLHAGVKKEFRMRLQAVYVVPNGQTRRPRAEKAIESALLAVQEHYRRQLGYTFILETPSVTVSQRVRSAMLSSLEASDRNSITSGFEYDIHRFAYNEYRESYFYRKNIIVFVVEGLAGTSYGTAGTVVISNRNWDPVYQNFVSNSSIARAYNAVSWSHEIGHSLGLLHLDNPENKNNECAIASKSDSASDIMLAEPNTSNLFDSNFIEWEKKRLLGENVSDYPNCSHRRPNTSLMNIRPVSESYLQLSPQYGQTPLEYAIPPR